MTGAIVSFTAMAVAGRAVSPVHDTFEIMMWRSAFGLAGVLAAIVVLGRLREVRTERLRGHILRNLTHFAGQNLWFWAITVAPLAQVFALEFTAPIWVVLLAPVFLGETLTRNKMLAAAIGFAGILIVARPDMGQLDPGLLAAAGAALCFAMTAIQTKSLTRHEGIVSILFWLTLIQLVFGILASFHDGQAAWPTLATLPWLALISICGLLAHFCLTTALSLASASVVMPMDFIRLPVIAIVGMAFYGEAVDLWVAIGAGIILLANWINLRQS
ncbi:DMT family transporter [Aliigemmobacter aestuarii]|uniref:DMT family transporter n=1 Tax=Aliigemmobacter aestuarii TaxID=1445661 RepID=A0A4S3MMY4_9RHOB|nr:DMT family transporter [Gemmobacter aestuarii]THD83192.1 DMT family transporter [Gemmobacter aestuarii]